VGISDTSAYRARDKLPAFAEQWERALKIDPAFVFVTGWNEWVAMRFGPDAPFQHIGAVNFVDTFNEEYSRDIEPMKGGHGDSYYYQLARYIRRYKGVRPPEAAGPPKTIRIDGALDDWRTVRPEFRDDAGDTAHRDHPGWGSAGRYVNRTGRNDLVACKVSRDDTHLYFYARTRASITPSDRPEGLRLFLDTDGSHRTGWEGYDFVVNRADPTKDRLTLEARSSDAGGWKRVATIPYRMAGNAMELAIRRDDLGLSDPKAPLRVDFKWADNLPQENDVTAFTTGGDAAPNARFNYRYTTEEEAARKRR
jgi:hypothetical protein